MKTVEIRSDDLPAWRHALVNSHSEPIIVRTAGYRVLLHNGAIMSQSGHSDVDVTPVKMDSRIDKIHSNGREIDGTGRSESYRRMIARAMSEDSRDEMLSEYDREYV